MKLNLVDQDATSLNISHKDSDIPDVDLSNVGVTKFGSFIVEVIDPVSTIGTIGVVDMSSGGNKDIPETSSPAAKRGKKGTMKGKKPKYVIKLPLQKAPVVESPIVQPNPSEAENVVPIPSQPSAVELTHSQPSIVQPMPSQPPIVQPMQPNINQLMPSQPLPSSMGSQCAVARCTSLSCSSQQNASPISMPSRDNQNVLQVDQQMSTETGEPSTVVDDDPAVGEVLEIIEACNDGFYPSRVASKAITKTIKQQFVQPWSSWGEIPDEQKTVFFERFKEEFQTLFSQAKSEAASCGGGEETSPLDQVEEEKLRNKSCSAADSQKIIRLEEDIRQSREENQRSQRKLESLVNVVLPILPPAAQIILQDMNEQPQNDHQNQNHAQEGEQHDGHSSSPHYADY
ncbi:hypothetical protein Fmac_015417 [Flemingia macrophylla]|uniref:Uncharacterized protein n=1 Tax=Flemingia macrophylla TaxID=520843 RepID=A0ABD1MEN7_9FABA